MRRVLAAVVVILGTLQAPGVAAHAVLLETVPGDRAVVAQAPDAITLRFDEPVQPVAVRLLDGAGRPVAAEVSARNETVGVAPRAPLPRGSYIVSWRVISADAHPVAGSFLFAVGEAPPSWQTLSLDAGGGAPWLAFAILNRAIQLAALMIAIGGAIYLLLIEPHDPARLRALRPALWGAAAVAAVTAALGVGIEGGLVLDASLGQILDAGPWRAGAATTRGPATMAALAGLGMVAAGLAGHGALSRVALALGAAAAIASFVLSGHAATASPREISIPALLIHVAVVAFWIGSLVPLRRALADTPPGAAVAVGRFSRIAVVAVPVLVIAGLILAVVQVRDIAALARPGYGMALFVKLILVAALLGIAAYNRLKLTPRLPQAASLLRESIAVELGLGLAILGATAVLSQTSPPRSLVETADPARSFSVGGVAPSVVVVARGLVATVEVSPGAVGRNTITVGIADTAGKPASPREVKVSLSNASVGIEEIERAMTRADDGTWRYEGPEFAVAGGWTVRIDALISDFDKAIFSATVPIR